MSTQLLPPPGHVVSADDTHLGVRRSGDGPPLVLVHGAAADHTRWAPVLPALERRFTVHALDRRGRGLSGDGPDHSLDREVDDVAAVVRAAGDDVAVLGHSFGAVLALEAALRTDAIARLVLYEGPVGFLQTPAAVVDRLQALLDAGDRDGLLECFLVQVAGLPREHVAQLRTLDAWQGRRAAAHTIPREERANREYIFDADRLSAVRVPTLLLGGGDSPAPFQAANAALCAALPDSRIAVMPGQRHAAMDTGTALFLDTVLPFLDPALP